MSEGVARKWCDGGPRRRCCCRHDHDVRHMETGGMCRMEWMRISGCSVTQERGGGRGRSTFQLHRQRCGRGRMGHRREWRMGVMWIVGRRRHPMWDTVLTCTWRCAHLWLERHSHHHDARHTLTRQAHVGWRGCTALTHRRHNGAHETKHNQSAGRRAFSR